jgi:N-acetylmuramoyl-L-alanine amidase
VSVINEDKIKLIVVHCSATPRGADITAEDINQMHIDRGWTEIGYHFFIRRDGRLEIGRDLDEMGAHVKGFNTNSWGVCLAGGLDRSGKAENNFTQAQFSTLRAILVVLKAMAPQAEILGHRDLSPDIDGDGEVEPWEWLKQCPCFDVRKWCEENNL